MTQITKEAIEALESARAHILDAYRIWQADDVSAVPPPKSGAGAVIAKIDAVLSSPIAVEGKVKALEWVDMGEGPRCITVCGMYAISPSSGPYGKEKLTLTGMPSTLFGKFDTISEAKAAAQIDYETRILSALISSPGKDGGQEVEAENRALRKIISDAASALPNGAFIHPEASVGFMEGLPKEIALVCSRPQPASTALVEAMRPHIEKLRGCVAINEAMGRVVEGQADATRALIAAFDALSASTSREGESRG